MLRGFTMKKHVLITITSFAMLLASCQTNTTLENNVVTTLFPQYSIARHLLDGIADVTFLLEAGQSPHDFEPTPSQVISLNRAKAVFYTSEIVEPWIHNVEDTARGQLIDLSSNITLLEGHEEHETSLEDDHDHGDEDPHYWIDPANALLMLSTISDTLIELFPEEEVILRSREETLRTGLSEVVTAYEDLLGPDQELDIVFAGHNVFGYLETYGIHVLSPYAGFSDDVLPTAQSLADFVMQMEELNTLILYVSSTDNQAIIEALIAALDGVETVEIFAIASVPSSLDLSTVTYEEMLMLNLEAMAQSL
jgi:zinc transport system substrate-binding protein